MVFTNLKVYVFMKQENLIFLPKVKWIRLLISLILLVVLMTGMAFAQQKTITGKVTDVNGSSIPGVSVILKGTTTGVTTNNDGKYSLTSSADAKILIFSFVGMRTQEVSIGNKTVIDVVLTDEITGVE